MRRVVIFLTLLALPQALDLVTLCDAAGYDMCYTYSDPSNSGMCSANYMCGSMKQGKHCGSVPNPDWQGLTSSAKRAKAPQAIFEYMCVCGG